MSSQELTMLTTLLLIARGKPECQGCDWQNPCDKCLASTVAYQVMESDGFEAWRKRWKIVARKRCKNPGKDVRAAIDAAKEKS